MTPQIIETGKARLCFSLLSPTFEFRIIDDDNLMIGTHRRNDGVTEKVCRQLPPGNWSQPYVVVGVTEEVAKLAVEDHTIPFHDDEICYPDYNHYGITGFKAFSAATESFQSLLKANQIYTVNPFGADPCKHNRQCFESCQGSCWPEDVDFDEWESAQINTGNWIMLIEEK